MADKPAMGTVRMYKFHNLKVIVADLEERIASLEEVIGSIIAEKK